MYIPTLTKELLDDPLAKDPIGLFVGDPCTDDVYQNKNRIDVETAFAYDFGFMTPEINDVLQSDECKAVYGQMFDAFYGGDKTRQKARKARAPAENRKVQMLRRRTTEHGAAAFKKCALALYEGSFGSSQYLLGDGIDLYGVLTPW